MPRRKRTSSPFELFDDDLDDISQSSRNGNPPVQRNAANARERARMRVLSSAFGRLKTKLPNIPPDTKLSKLDTLRLATMYIKNLRAMAEGNATASMNADAISPMHFSEHGNISGISNGAQNLSWPFGLHHIASQNSTSRQLPHHQCPLVDWSPATTDHSKCADFESYSSQHQPQSVIPWQSTHNFSNNNFNMCNNSNQIHQNFENQQISHNYSASMHNQHHQNNMSPIR